VRLAVNTAVGAGSVLVAGSAAVHFYLWDSEGFRNIPTIGPLFLAQAIVGWALALATVTTRKLPLVLVACGYGIVSACALIYSVLFGLFGWQERLGAPYVGLALAIEFAAGAVLLGAASVMARQWLRRRRQAGPTDC
jgi:CHASE2 domain-containing sensor protein